MTTLLVYVVTAYIVNTFLVNTLFARTSYQLGNEWSDVITGSLLFLFGPLSLPFIMCLIWKDWYWLKRGYPRN